MKNFKFGFTLAEVLITLAIIGVVAALTIPTLNAKINERRTVTALKVAYADFSQGFKLLAEANGGTLRGIGNQDNSISENSKILLSELRKHMITARTCESSEGCMNDKYKSLPGKTISWGNFDKDSQTQTGVLNNSSSFFLVVNNPLDNRFAQLGIDTNGVNKPNQFGKDLFMFWVSTDGQVIPLGSKAQVSFYAKTHTEEETNTFLENSNKSCSIFNNLDDVYNGYYCTGWVLENENLDYLKKEIDLKEFRTINK